MKRQDQEIFNILLETISEAVIIVDDSQHIVEINNNAKDIFGYDNSEIKGKSINLLIPSNYHKEHVKKVDRFVKAYEHRKMGKTTDVYGLKKSGDIIAVEVELNPFKIYNKTYVMALIKDVSKQKENEFDFMLRSKALESASNGILITDAQKPDNPIIYFNKAFMELTGYSKDEILNKNCRFLQGNDRAQQELDKLRAAIKSGKSTLVTLRNYRKDGSLFYNDLYVTPIVNKRGLVTNYIGIQNDVTERIKAEEERNHLAKIFDESLNEIYVFDAKTYKFVNANRGAQKNLGYTTDELKNITPLELKVAGSISEFEQNYIQPLITEKVERLEFETIHMRKDGSTYPVYVNLQLSNLNEKQVFVAIIVDISEQKNYTKKLEKTVEVRTQELRTALAAEKELNELKTKFLSMVSHEFKTPLSGMMTSAILLQKYQLTEQQDKREKHITTITDKIKYLNKILNDFLSVEKLEKGKVNYRFTEFNLSKVLNEVIYSANMLLKTGQRIKYPENINEISLYQDEKILELILSNIIYNAIKYSSENTDISIAVTQNQNSTVIRITDEGIGIPKEDQKNIFKRYYRAENVLNMQGTGIGLNIVKDHLDNLNGKITFNSTEHKGTTFTIEIPNTAE